MKIRTLDDLLQKIAEDRVWRIREIVMLKRTCLNPAIGEREKDVQRRALIPLAYAHWEGFVKGTGQSYLDFVAGQRLTLAQLTPCFQSIYFSIELSRELRAEKRHKVIGVLRGLSENASSRVHLKTKGVISTQDNLNSDALHDVCMNLGLNYSRFSAYASFIDKVLLAKRNCIAHGENIFITEDNVDEVCENVVACIDNFRTEVENSAVNESYKQCRVP